MAWLTGLVFVQVDVSHYQTSAAYFFCFVLFVFVFPSGIQKISPPHPARRNQRSGRSKSCMKTNCSHDCAYYSGRLRGGVRVCLLGWDYDNQWSVFCCCCFVGFLFFYGEFSLRLQFWRQRLSLFQESLRIASRRAAVLHPDTISSLSLSLFLGLRRYTRGGRCKENVTHLAISYFFEGIFCAIKQHAGDLLVTFPSLLRHKPRTIPSFFFPPFFSPPLSLDLADFSFASPAF